MTVASSIGFPEPVTEGKGGNSLNDVRMVCDSLLTNNGRPRRDKQIKNEGGYNVSDSSGEFLANTPAIQAHLRTETPSQSVFGLVFQAAQLRRQRRLGGVTIMSCDNIQGNGSVARVAFLAFADAKLEQPEPAEAVDVLLRVASSELSEADFVDWLRQSLIRKD